MAFAVNIYKMIENASRKLHGNMLNFLAIYTWKEIFKNPSFSRANRYLLIVTRQKIYWSR